jgi:hypothetical protein
MKIKSIKKIKNVVQIELPSKTIWCTTDHNIFTKRGWISANRLTTIDEVQELAREQNES